MQFLERLFTRDKAGTASVAGPASAPPSRLHGNTRRELMRVVLRDVVARHGIPSHWLSGELVPVPVPGQPQRPPMLHLRVVIRHWDPRLLECTVALQQHLRERACMYDPACEQWLQGISWQFDLPSTGVCPDMPDPQVWKTPPGGALTGTAAPRRENQATRDRKAELHRMLSANDSTQLGADNPAFASTQPMFRPTQPM
jgi:hypothetical protein